MQHKGWNECSRDWVYCLTYPFLILALAALTKASDLTITQSINVAIFSLIVSLLLLYFLSNERADRREVIVMLFLYFLFMAISLGWIQIAQTA